MEWMGGLASCVFFSPFIPGSCMVSTCRLEVFLNDPTFRAVMHSKLVRMLHFSREALKHPSIVSSVHLVI